MDDLTRSRQFIESSSSSTNLASKCELGTSFVILASCDLLDTIASLRSLHRSLVLLSPNIELHDLVSAVVATQLVVLCLV